MPIKIFFCYAREDEPLLKKMKIHLAALERQGLIDVWHDRNISAGTEWEHEINRHLNEADIILLLISPNFMASDYCYSKEMKWAMDRHERGEARVIPIILRPVANWKEAPFGKLQALPKDAEPITDASWRKLDKALSNVSEGIRRVIDELIDQFALRRTLTGHSLPIWSIAISPDGQTLVSGSDDTTIKLWNLQTGELFGTLEGHSGYIWYVAISPDGKTLASASHDTTIKIWNLQAGELLHTLIDHSNWVKSVTISPDGQTLVSGSADGTIKLWNLQTGELLRTLEKHAMTGHVNSVVISPDGQLLVSGSADGTIRLWNLQTGKLLQTLEGDPGIRLSRWATTFGGHYGAVCSVAISPDGQTLVSSGDDSTIRVWDLHTGRLLNILTGHFGCVNSVAISPDGQTLASSSDDTTIKLWNLKVAERRRPLLGSNKFNGLDNLTTRERETLQLMSQGSTNRGVAQRLHISEKTVQKHVQSIFSKLGIFDRSSAAAAAISDLLESQYQRLLLQTLRGHSNWVKSIAFGPLGHILVSSSCDQTIKIWKKK